MKILTKWRNFKNKKLQMRESPGGMSRTGTINEKTEKVKEPSPAPSRKRENKKASEEIEMKNTRLKNIMANVDKNREESKKQRYM